jgi:hypothetical protein
MKRLSLFASARKATPMIREPTPPGHVMIRCAESGESVPAGVSIDAATFKTSTLSDQTVRCPHCGQEHTWSKKDAWIEEAC